MKKDHIIFLSFATLILLIYGQSLWGGFVFDDRGILDYHSILSGLGSLKAALLQPYWEVDAGLYRPITLLSYALNIIFLGGSAMSFHLVNLALYFGICSAIFVFLRKLFSNEKLALLSTLIYLVLPIHTEVVANITGRSELLALFFSILTLIEFTKEKSNFWLAGLYILLAIGAKETAVAVLPLAFLVILIKEGGLKRELLGKYFRPFSASVIGTCLYFFARFFILGPDHFLGIQTSLIENPLLFASASSRIATGLSILRMYVQKTFWPFGLCSDYSFNQVSLVSFSNFGAILGLLILVAGAISTFYFWKRKPIISLASAIFVVSFLPVSNLFFLIGTIAGERLFFFPSLGFAILMALVLSKLEKKAVIIALLIIYSAIAFNRQSVWLTEEKLFLNAVECAPNSVLSRSNAGAAYLFRGELDKAAEQLEISREIKPIYSKGLNNLGLVYWKMGHNSEAERLYHEALTQKYPYAGAIENLILLNQSEQDENGVLRWLRIAYPNVSDSQLLKSLR